MNLNAADRMEMPDPAARFSALLAVIVFCLISAFSPLPFPRIYIRTGVFV